MGRILCVDDDENITQYLEVILSNEGHEVITASSAKEGLQAILKSIPDIIFCDIDMPEMNGYKFLAAVREDHHDDDIPLVFMSALNDEQEQIIGLELGADNYITKPFSREIVCAKATASLRQVCRMKKKKEDEHVKIYQAMIDKIKSSDVATFEAYDIHLERLNTEYENRMELRQKVIDMRHELSVQKHTNDVLSIRLNAIDASLEASINIIKRAKEQVLETQKAINNGEPLSKIKEAVQEASDQLEVQIIPVRPFSF